MGSCGLLHTSSMCVAPVAAYSVRVLAGSLLEGLGRAGPVVGTHADMLWSVVAQCDSCLSAAQLRSLAGLAGTAVSCSALALHGLGSPPDLVVCPGCRLAVPTCQLNSCLCCLQSLRCAADQVGVQQALAEAALQLHQWMLHLQPRQLLSITGSSLAVARLAVSQPTTCRALVPSNRPVQRHGAAAQPCRGAVRCCSAHDTSAVNGHQGSHEAGCGAPGLGVGPLHRRLHPGQTCDVMSLEVKFGAAHATCDSSGKVWPWGVGLSSANSANGQQRERSVHRCAVREKSAMHEDCMQQPA